MIWLLIAYLIVLAYLSVNRAKLADPVPLRAAWNWFAWIPLSHALFTIFRAGNARDARALALVEIWAEGFAWLFLALSVFYAARAVAPSSSTYTTFGSGDVPPPAP